MQSEESPRAAAPPLAHRIAADANAAQMADAVVAVWQEIDAALAPIIGPRGVAALYARSLYLTSASHPWLGHTHESVQAQMDLAALKSVFRQQSSANAASGGNALFQTFYELLASLIGPSLSERLLRPVWGNSPSGPPAQDYTT
jgi:hypothetical protein